jgi:hypothetical protein
MPDDLPPVSEADRARIAAAATDYIASWIDGDPERMARCLHPALAKRSVEPDERGDATLDETTYGQMVEGAGAGRGRRVEPGFDVTILDAVGDIASVRVASSAYIDYLHIARFGDRWLLVNVLWQPRPA